MDVFDPLDALVVDLRLQVFFGDVLAQLLSSVHSLKALALLQRRCVDILFLGEGECENAVEQPLEQFVKLFLLVTQQGLVNDVAYKLLLQDYQAIQVAHLVEPVQQHCPG